MYKLKFIISILVFLSFNQVFAGTYNYPYVCSDSTCDVTNTEVINDSSTTDYYLYNTSFGIISNIKTFINQKISYNSNGGLITYDSTKDEFYLSNLCDDSICSSTTKSVVDPNNTTTVYKYLDPINGGTINNMKNLINKIVSYDSNNGAITYDSANDDFYLNDYCSNIDCSLTKKLLIDPNNTTKTYRYLMNGNIETITDMKTFVNKDVSYNSNNGLISYDSTNDIFYLNNKCIDTSCTGSVKSQVDPNNTTTVYKYIKSSNIKTITNMKKFINKGVSSFNSNGGLISYNSTNDTYYLKNGCKSFNDCSSTNYLEILDPSNTTTSYKYLVGTKGINPIKNNLFFIDDSNSNNLKYDKSSVIAGSGVNMTYIFDDYLDYSSSSTNYTYTIKYKYDNGPITKYLSENITIDKTTLKDTGGNKGNISVISSDFVTKKIRVSINEGINLTKAGNIVFYLDIKNNNTGITKSYQVNYGSISVIPSSNLKSGSMQILFGNRIYDGSTSFSVNAGDTFIVNIKDIRDIYDNSYYDYTSGFEISLLTQLGLKSPSQYIELSKEASPNYSTILTGVKTDGIAPYGLSFKFRVTKSGYNNFYGFKLKTVNGGILELKAPDKYGNMLTSIYVNTAQYSDYLFTYKSGPITVNSICTSDNFSGCNPYGNQSIVFNNEYYNGITGTMYIQDYAYNVKTFQYNMHHIDQSPPGIQNLSGIKDLKAGTANLVFSGTMLDDANKSISAKTIYGYNFNTCSACKINGTIRITGPNGYNSVQSFTRQSTEFIDLTYGLTKVGDYYISMTLTDKAGNVSSPLVNKKIHIYPSDKVDEKSITVSSLDNKYANNSDKYNYIINLKDIYGNIIYNKPIKSIIQTGTKTIKTNMTSNPISGDNALILEYTNLITSSTGTTTFTIKSLTPGVFTQKFEIRMQKWDDNYLPIPNTEEISFLSRIEDNSFLKPFTGKIEAYDKDFNNWNAKPQIGSTMKYRLTVNKLSTLSNNFTLDNGVISSFLKKVVGLRVNENTINQYIELQNKYLTGSNNTISNINLPIEFMARVNNSKTSTSLNNPYEIGFGGDNLPIISYDLGGKSIQYYLSSDNSGGGNLRIVIAQNKFFGVNVNGTIQSSSDSKRVITGQGKNFSDLSQSKMRSDIRKNAYTFTKSMKSGTIVNKVIYFVGDVNISSITGVYETIVVKDGNLIIDQDIPSRKTPLGIIILKDKYDVKSDYTGKGNIYIKPNVKNINAIIYSDGGLISADSNGKPYLTEDSRDVSGALTIKGSLFTRNTIGGAILSSDGYLLPGGVLTDDFDNAMIYDLNYLRMGKVCSTPACSSYKTTFNINYDPKVQTNPPKLFYN